MKKLILLKLAVYGALALAPLHDARAEGVHYADIKGAWSVYAYPATGNAAESCMASATYGNEMVGISITIDQQASFGLASPKIAQNLIDGKLYAFRVYVNNKLYNTIDGKVQSGMVFFNIEPTGLDMLMDARNIGFETGLLSFGYYNLKYSTLAITKTQECVAVLQTTKRMQPQAQQQPQEQQPSISADPISSTTRSF